MKIPSQIFPITRLKRNFGTDEFDRMVELFPAPAMVLDRLNLRISLANRRALELSYYMKNELIGRRLQDLFASDPGQAGWEDRFAAQDSIQLTLIRHNKSPLEVQAKFDEISNDGRWLFISLEPILVTNKRGTDRQRFNELLDEFRDLVEASQQTDMESGLRKILLVGLRAISATSGAIYQVNGPNMELKLQVSTEPTFPIELPAQDIVHLRTAQVWVPGKRSQAYLHNLAKTAGYSFLASAPIGDPHAIIGVMVYASVSASPIEQTIPLINILAGSAHNIIQSFSKQSNLNAELEEQKSYQRFVDVAQNSIQDSVIVLSHDFKVMILNQAAEICLGYKQKEALGLHVQKILFGSEDVMPALRIAQQGIPTFRQDNVTLVRRSGESFLATVSTMPVKSNGEVEGTVIIIQDRSEEEKTRAQTEQLEQQAMLGTVTAVFAHEVRNPLNSLSTGLQLMAYQLPLDDPQRELVVKMQADCDRLEELMKNVLIFARSAEYEMEPVDLCVLVGRLLDRMHPRLVSGKVKPHFSANPDTPLIMGNPRALEQVFSNLFTNAIQAMEASGGVLGVKVQAAETTGKRQYAVVTVADNGPGIPKEDLDRIFTPFFTTKSTGTGLGLAIIKRIVTAHKGLILASSVPGATLFTVQIPAIQQPSDDQ